jgi:thioredoxin reductase (NADPH)
MLTVDELRPVAVFASLSDADLERLASEAEDITLAAGEYAVFEGGERAFFAVISGRLEVVKLIDGVERTLGWRAPGVIFGEVPLALGTPFPGAYRAAEPSRVMRLDARQYHELAAAAPDVALQMGALARQRIGGLQEIAAETPSLRVTVVGERWNPECSDVRRFLARNEISFEWLTPDSPDLGRRWPEAVGGETCPILRLEREGAVLVRPSARELAERLGLQTKPHLSEYDTVIIGGGPAGLAAAVYGASEGLRTLVVEREAPGGQAGTSSRIENYLGFPSGVSGDELASRALRQARRLGAEILVTRAIEGLDPHTRDVHLDGGETICTRTVIVATGVSWRRLALDGFDRLIGKGVYYGAARSEAGGTHGLDIHLIGAGNSAGQAALHFARFAKKVTLLVRGSSLDDSMSHYLIEQVMAKTNIFPVFGCEVCAVRGESHLTAVDICDRATGRVRTEDSGGLFVFIGADAETGWLPPEIARDDKGYVLTGDDVVKAGRWGSERDPYLLETSVPGMFACGDVRLSPVKRVASAVGEGSMAIALIHQYLRRLDEG